MAMFSSIALLLCLAAGISQATTSPYCCEQEGWGGEGTYDVCSKSEARNGCSGSVTYNSNWCAQNFGNGARLCTLSELQAGEAAATGECHLVSCLSL
jgi:hypothetical protein